MKSTLGGAFPLLARCARSSIAAGVAVCAMTAGCHVPTHDDDEDAPAEIVAPLVVELDGIAVRHGELRIAASIEDGSPDVSLWTGSACEGSTSERSERGVRSEIGHGIATRTGFVWSLGNRDLERALQCGIVVSVRVIEDGVRMRKEKELSVALVPVIDGQAEVRLVKNELDGDSTRLAFRTPGRATRLRVGAVLMGAEESETEEDAAGPFTSEWVVENGDLARAILSRRPLVVDGASVPTVVTVGNVALDLNDDIPEG